MLPYILITIVALFTISATVVSWLYSGALHRRLTALESLDRLRYSLDVGHDLRSESNHRDILEELAYHEIGYDVLLWSDTEGSTVVNWRRQAIESGKRRAEAKGDDQETPR